MLAGQDRVEDRLAFGLEAAEVVHATHRDLFPAALAGLELRDREQFLRRVLVGLGVIHLRRGLLLLLRGVTDAGTGDEHDNGRGCGVADLHALTPL